MNGSQDVYKSHKRIQPVAGPMIEGREVDSSTGNSLLGEEIHIGIAIMEKEKLDNGGELVGIDATQTFN